MTAEQAFKVFKVKCHTTSDAFWISNREGMGSKAQVESLDCGWGGSLLHRNRRSWMRVYTRLDVLLGQWERSSDSRWLHSDRWGQGVERVCTVWRERKDMSPHLRYEPRGLQPDGALSGAHWACDVRAERVTFPQRPAAARCQGCCQACTVQRESTSGLDCVYSRLIQNTALASKLCQEGRASRREDGVLHKVEE